MAFPLLLPVSRADGLKIASFDAPRAFEAYEAAQAERAKFAEARKKVRTDERLERLKLTNVELDELRDKVRDASLSEDSRQEYYRKFQMKAHEVKSLRRDIENYREEQNRLINEAMVRQTKKLLDNIRAVVRRIAGENGYDVVMETGGTTSSQVSTLIYIRDATDITDRVIAELNDTSSAADDVATTNKAVPAEP